MACYLWLIFVEVFARDESDRKGAGRAWRTLFLTLKILGQNVHGGLTRNQWVKSMMRKARNKSKEFIEKEGAARGNGERLWNEDGSFRGYFFRGLMKEMMVPLVINRHGKKDGAFFRDAVPVSIEKWVEGLGLTGW